MDSDNAITWIIIALVIILCIMIFSSYIKKISVLLLKAGVGALVIYMSNILMAPLGISVGINIFTLIISAFLGLPGIILIYAVQAVL